MKGKKTDNTSKKIHQILPHILDKINDAHKQKPQRVLEIWPEIIGKELAPMAKAISFKKGILTVIVKNSTLHSLFCQYEKQKIIKKLQEKLEKIIIRDINFRIG